MALKSPHQSPYALDDLTVRASEINFKSHKSDKPLHSTSNKLIQCFTFQPDFCFPYKLQVYTLTKTRGVWSLLYFGLYFCVGAGCNCSGLITNVSFNKQPIISTTFIIPNHAGLIMEQIVENYSSGKKDYGCCPLYSGISSQCVLLPTAATYRSDWLRSL